MIQKIFMTSIENNILDPPYTLPNIHFINHVINEPTWVAGPVKHNDWCEIVYINNGRAFYTINHKHYTVTKGDLIIFNEGMIHDASSDTIEPVERWSCGFKKLKLKNREFNHIIPKGASPVIPIGHKGNMLNNLFEIMFEKLNSPCIYTFNICQYAICTMLYLVSDILNVSPEINENNEERTLANEIIDYIDHNFYKPLSIEMLSKEFFISSSHLNHIVKKNMNISPIDYMINRRIGEAQCLLMSTMHPIHKIAELVGYSNTNHFIASFKKKLGVPPGQFRKRLNIPIVPPISQNNL